MNETDFGERGGAMRTDLERALPLVVGTQVHENGVLGTHDVQLAPPVTRAQ